MLVLTVGLALVPVILMEQNTALLVAKSLAIAFLSFLPGWFYLVFNHKLQGLYDEYVLTLFRLRIDDYRSLPSPPESSKYWKQWNRAQDRSSARGRDNPYRRKFEDVYGGFLRPPLRLIGDEKRPRLAHRRGGERFSSVLAATALVGAGWALVLQPGLLARVSSAGLPNLPYRALMFAFFGAYAFTLKDLIRRYYRDDLRASAYIGAALRLVIGVMVVVALDLVLGIGSPELEIAAFLIGFFPHSGLVVLKPGRRRSVVVLPKVRSAFRLSQLDGMNLWCEARLREEGIEDIQNLVTSDLADLVLRARVPVRRLIDWMDQAFLLLHVPAVKLEKPGPTAASSPDGSPRENLRVMGIRTATDFERAWHEHGKDPDFCGAIGRALNVAEESGRAVAASIVTALEGEPNLRHIREYRNMRPAVRKSSPHHWQAPGSAPAEVRPRHLATG